MGMIGVWLATWMLVGQVAMQPCTGAAVKPLPGLSTVTAGVRAFPSWRPVSRRASRWSKRWGGNTTTMQVRDPQTGQPATVRYAIVWSCQRPARGE